MTDTPLQKTARTADPRAVEARSDLQAFASNKKLLHGPQEIGTDLSILGFVYLSMMRLKINRAFLAFRSPGGWRQGSTCSADLQNGRPGGVDIGH